jgi:hypothetical protein
MRCLERKFQAPASRLSKFIGTTSHRPHPHPTTSCDVNRSTRGRFLSGCCRAGRALGARVPAGCHRGNVEHNGDQQPDSRTEPRRSQPHGTFSYLFARKARAPETTRRPAAPYRPACQRPRELAQPVCNPQLCPFVAAPTWERRFCLSRLAGQDVGLFPKVGPRTERRHTSLLHERLLKKRELSDGLARARSAHTRTRRGSSGETSSTARVHVFPLEVKR